MAPALIKAAGDCFYDGRASSYCSSDTTITTTPAAAATAAALLQWHSLPAISLCRRRAVCAALSDSVRRKILIPARVPFSDFYFYVLSFNFGAAAAAVAAAAALAVHTGCRCLRVRLSWEFLSFHFPLWLLADLSLAASLTTIQKIFLFACLFLCWLRLQPVPTNTYTMHPCIDYNFIRLPLCVQLSGSSARCEMRMRRATPRADKERVISGSTFA
jgi:hypothetical protein